MGTLSHRPQNNKPQNYTIYALANPDNTICWEEIKYIGVSINIQYRYGQHLSRRDKDQKEKCEWIQSLLARNAKPVLYRIEDVEGRKEALAREQYWIRYAISQGAKLFNKAITYTEEERVKAHQERAAYYAQILELKRQGFFIKRSVYWHPSSVALDGHGEPQVDRLHLRDFPLLALKNDEGELIGIADCSDAFFDAFIKQYLKVYGDDHDHWTWEDRLEAINAALVKGRELDLYQQEPAKKSKKKSRKR